MKSISLRSLVNKQLWAVYLYICPRLFNCDMQSAGVHTLYACCIIIMNQTMVCKSVFLLWNDSVCTPSLLLHLCSLYVCQVVFLCQTQYSGNLHYALQMSVVHLSVWRGRDGSQSGTTRKRVHSDRLQLKNIYLSMCLHYSFNFVG